jgi:hypothetical protein
MTFLQDSTPTTNTTVLPDFQYLTSPASEQSLATTPNHISMYPIPNAVDVNQYGTHNITNQQNLHSNPTHVKDSSRQQRVYLKR